jgi:hypothetical protein
MSASGDEFTISYESSPEDAALMRALPKLARTKKAGRTFTPSVHARPLPGAPGSPVRDPDVEERGS